MSGSVVTYAGDGPRTSLGRLSDRAVRRRITLVWALLFFNVLPWMGIATVVPIPQRLAQLLAFAALGAAALVALSVNPRLLVRPSIVLGLFTLLAAVALMTSVRGTAGVGGVLRSFRLAAFLMVLWLLTPWWGRRDLLLARCHLRVLVGVSATVLAGLLITPSLALSGPGGRLIGVLWPVWPTAVAHFAAVAAGMGIVLWLSGRMTGARALALGGGGTAMVLATQTRTALVGLVVAVVCAAFSLFLARRRVRRAATVALMVTPIAALALAPALTSWFTRGQSAEELKALTGRRQVWEMLLAAPRSEFNHWFGSGLSDKGFAGRSIDNTWLAVYQDQGLVGAALVAAALVFLLLSPAFRPAGAPRALALFLAVYCAVDSFTEVGLGDASTYLLDVVVAASLLAPPPDEEGDPDDGWVPT